MFGYQDLMSILENVNISYNWIHQTIIPQILFNTGQSIHDLGPSYMFYTNNIGIFHDNTL